MLSKIPLPGKALTALLLVPLVIVVISKSPEGAAAAVQGLFGLGVRLLEGFADALSAFLDALVAP